MPFPYLRHPGFAAGLLLAALPCLAPAAEAPAASAAATPPPTQGVLRALVEGDRGCYLELEDASGARHEVLGDFALCERRAALGARVRLDYREASVAAASCQGAPDCAESERVSLVVELHEER